MQYNVKDTVCFSFLFLFFADVARCNHQPLRAALTPARLRSLKFLYSSEDDSEVLAPAHPLVSSTPAGICTEPKWTCGDLENKQTCVFSASKNLKCGAAAVTAMMTHTERHCSHWLACLNFPGFHVFVVDGLRLAAFHRSRFLGVFFYFPVQG